MKLDIAASFYSFKYFHNSENPVLKPVAVVLSASLLWGTLYPAKTVFWKKARSTMASLICTFMVLIAAFGLITGIPVQKTTTKKTSVTTKASSLPTYPYIYGFQPPSVPHVTSTNLFQTPFTHYPYIYKGTQPGHHISSTITTNHAPAYPYVYGWSPSTHHVSTGHVNYQATPYPYSYGWQSPFSHFLPNNGLSYGYPTSPYGGLFGYY